MRQYSTYIPLYTINQERSFVDFLNRHKAIIYHVIKKNDFVREHEIDDYYQEATMYAWRRYFHFDRSKSSFSTWLYQTTEWAVKHYHRFLRRDKSKTIYVDECASWFDMEDDPYSEEHIESLYNAIEELTPEEKTLTLLVLSGEQGTSISMRLGRAPAYMERKMKRIKEKIRAKKDKYFPDLPIDPGALQTRPITKAPVPSTSRKPVIMLNKEGKFIKRFESITEVEAEGFSRKVVSNICRGLGHMHKGYRWQYEGETRPEILNRVVKTAGEGQQMKAVNQYDIWGTFIRRFESKREAINAGFHLSNIRKFKKGETRKCQGYLWELCD